MLAMSQFPAGTSAAVAHRLGMLLRNPPDPLGFIEPCAPVLYEVAPAGPDWLHEIKHDGWRMVARKDGDRVACGAASARIGRRTSPRSLPLSRICRMSALCSMARWSGMPP